MGRGIARFRKSAPPCRRGDNGNSMTIRVMPCSPTRSRQSYMRLATISISAGITPK
jgi:hypothetical protein